MTDISTASTATHSQRQSHSFSLCAPHRPILALLVSRSSGNPTWLSFTLWRPERGFRTVWLLCAISSPTHLNLLRLICLRVPSRGSASRLVRPLNVWAICHFHLPSVLCAYNLPHPTTQLSASMLFRTWALARVAAVHAAASAE